MSINRQKVILRLKTGSKPAASDGIQQDDADGSQADVIITKSTHVALL